MEYYLSLGSNMGDSKAILESAVDEIGLRIGRVVKVSSVFRTAPWGFEADNDFLNAALIVESAMPPAEVMSVLLEIERQRGRVRTDECTGYSSRPLDIDIIFAASEVIDTQDVTVPHPRAHLRRFVLEPMAEIAPDFVHPVLGKSVAQLLAECPDESRSVRLV